MCVGEATLYLNYASCFTIKPSEHAMQKNDSELKSCLLRIQEPSSTTANQKRSIDSNEPDLLSLFFKKKKRKLLLLIRKSNGQSKVEISIERKFHFVYSASNI